MGERRQALCKIFLRAHAVNWCSIYFLHILFWGFQTVTTRTSKERLAGRSTSALVSQLPILRKKHTLQEENMKQTAVKKAWIDLNFFTQG
jgi:hypothetical protein